MNATDGTQVAESSPANSGVGTSSSPATNTHDEQREESSASQGVKSPTSLRAALATVKPEVAQGSANGNEDGSADGSPPTEEAQDGQAAADGAAGTQDGQPAAKANADGSLNVPFGQRPEWKAMLALAGDRKADAIKALRPVFEQNQHLTEKVRQLEPMAEVVGELRQHTGDERGFETMRNIVRTYATAPDEAIPVLESMLKDARQRAGLEITSPDLKARLEALDKKVEAGVLDADEAATWKADLTAAETARAKQRQVESTMQRNSAQQRQQNEQAVLLDAARKLEAWEENIRNRDPDFGNVTPENDPEHGRSLADQVYDGLVLYRMKNPASAPAEALKEADRVYKLARSRMGGGRIREQRVLTSEGSSTTMKPEPKSMREALARIPRERG